MEARPLRVYSRAPRRSPLESVRDSENLVRATEPRGPAVVRSSVFYIVLGQVRRPSLVTATQYPWVGYTPLAPLLNNAAGPARPRPGDPARPAASARPRASPTPMLFRHDSNVPLVHPRNHSPSVLPAESQHSRLPTGASTAGTVIAAAALRGQLQLMQLFAQRLCRVHRPRLHLPRLELLYAQLSHR